MIFDIVFNVYESSYIPPPVIKKILQDITIDELRSLRLIFQTEINLYDYKEQVYIKILIAQKLIELIKNGNY